VILSESWLSPILSNGILDPKSLFNIYRKDRSDGYGGACIFVSKNVQSYVIDPVKEPILNREIVGCKIICKDIYVSIYCVYCPPNISLDLLTSTLKCLHSLCVGDKTSVIFGDWNLPGVD